MRQFRRLIAVLIAAALAPVSLLAQEAATVTGRVTNAQGQPEAAVLVRIESLNAGASTGADGTYRLVIPGARIRAGQAVQDHGFPPGAVARFAQRYAVAGRQPDPELPDGRPDHPPRGRGGHRYRGRRRGAQGAVRR